MTDDRKCPKCGTVMCEKFNYREAKGMTLAIPTGKYSCMRCGYDPGNGMSTVDAQGKEPQKP